MDQRRKVAVYLPERVVKEVERIAQELCISKSAALAILLRLGVAEWLGREHELLRELRHDLYEEGGEE